MLCFFVFFSWYIEVEFFFLGGESQVKCFLGVFFHKLVFFRKE